MATETFPRMVVWSRPLVNIFTIIEREECMCMKASSNLFSSSSFLVSMTELW